MRKIRALSIFLFSLLFSFCPSLQAADISIVVSVRPLYGIVAALTQGINEPKLLLETSDSPHIYALKPADMVKLNQADLIIWIGTSYEGFLSKPLAEIAPEKILTLETLPSLVKFPLRSGGLWGDHHHSHGHSHHSHGHSHHSHDHSHHSHADEGHPKKAAPGLKEKELDGHIWLHPKNGEVMARAIAERLIVALPDHKEAIAQNLNALLQNLEATSANVQKIIEPVQTKAFVVFHDSYQYFEEAFGVQCVGSVLLDPELPANALHIDKLRHMLLERKAHCLFSEPQFEANIVKSLEEQSSCHVGVLDPLGADIPLSATHYLDLLHNLAQDLVSCLNQ